LRFALWQWGFVPTIVIVMGIYTQTVADRVQRRRMHGDRRPGTEELRLLTTLNSAASTARKRALDQI